MSAIVVGEPLQLRGLVVGEPVRHGGGGRQRPDQPALDDQRHDHQRAQLGARQQRHARTSARSGTTTGSRGAVPGRACRASPGASRLPEQRLGQPAHRDDLELVVEVMREQHVRRVGRDRVPHPLGRQREVLLDAQPHQRVVTQTEGAAGAGGDRPGDEGRVLEERPLRLRDERGRRCPCRRPRGVCEANTVAVVPSAADHGVGALPAARARPGTPRSSGGPLPAAGSTRSA